ncbi:MAG: hypothetical protein HY537_19035 [Deltaproteobacteria bacterium]|nr:hypothetical protein [Deltaproteobacteria bacterium]
MKVLIVVIAFVGALISQHSQAQESAYEIERREEFQQHYGGDMPRLYGQQRVMHRGMMYDMPVYLSGEKCLRTLRLGSHSLVLDRDSVSIGNTRRKVENYWPGYSLKIVVKDTVRRHTTFGGDVTHKRNFCIRSPLQIGRKSADYDTASPKLIDVIEELGVLYNNSYWNPSDSTTYYVPSEGGYEFFAVVSLRIRDWGEVVVASKEVPLSTVAKELDRFGKYSIDLENSTTKERGTVSFVKTEEHSDQAFDNLEYVHWLQKQGKRGFKDERPYDEVEYLKEKREALK